MAHQFQFYVPPFQIKDDSAIISGDEFKHCFQVLQKRVNDIVQFFGCGKT